MKKEIIPNKYFEIYMNDHDLKEDQIFLIKYENDILSVNNFRFHKNTLQFRMSGHSRWYEVKNKELLGKMFSLDIKCYKLLPEKSSSLYEKLLIEVTKNDIETLIKKAIQKDGILRWASPQGSRKLSASVIAESLNNGEYVRLKDSFDNDKELNFCLADLIAGIEELISSNKFEFIHKIDDFDTEAADFAIQIAVFHETKYCM